MIWPYITSIDTESYPCIILLRTATIFLALEMTTPSSTFNTQFILSQIISISETNLRHYNHRLNSIKSTFLVSIRLF